jgi:hypothetical protein
MIFLITNVRKATPGVGVAFPLFFIYEILATNVVPTTPTPIVFNSHFVWLSLSYY